MKIGDVIDLHTFRPSDIRNVVIDYIEEAYKSGYRVVRIIHGKGADVQRGIVHSILSRSKYVFGFYIDPFNRGATLVELNVNRGIDE